MTEYHDGDDQDQYYDEGAYPDDADYLGNYQTEDYPEDDGTHEEWAYDANPPMIPQPEDYGSDDDDDDDDEEIHFPIQLPLIEVAENTEMDDDDPTYLCAACGYHECNGECVFG